MLLYCHSSSGSQYVRHVVLLVVVLVAVVMAVITVNYYRYC
jgi:hypothetical protein